MAHSIIVSGGSRGLGKEIISSFLENTDICVSTFSRKKTTFIEELLEDDSLKSRFYYEPVDLLKQEKINNFVKNVNRKFGFIDTIFHHAGIAIDSLLALQPEHDINKLIQINLIGTLILTKACVRSMLIKKWGRIINLTSIVGKSGYRGLSIYSATKAGLDGFTRSLARELGERGITVNSIAPGFLETEMIHGLNENQVNQIIRRTPLGRLGTPKDVIPIINFLCSDGAAFITGQSIIVDGGLSA